MNCQVLHRYEKNQIPHRRKTEVIRSIQALFEHYDFTQIKTMNYSRSLLIYYVSDYSKFIMNKRTKN